MMTFCLFLENEIITRRDVYGGNSGSIGRLIGIVPGGVIGYGLGGDIGAKAGISIGSAIGGQVGKYLGQAIASNPDALADFSKPLHRTGYLAMPLTGAYGFASDMMLPPMVTSVGTSLYNALSNDGTKKLGYDNLGRVAGAVAGPVIGLVPPDKIKQLKQLKYWSK